jgi:secondary thiamine-phosphate synthase enzyme
MRTHRHEHVAATPEAPGFVDITDEVERALASAEIANGRVLINAHDGCPVVINEFEQGLVTDVKRIVKRLQDSDSEYARRIGSSSVVLPAEAGRLRLGVWQRILLLELERPCERSVSIQITGD